MATKLYSQRDVERHIQLESALEVVERTYVETANGRVLNPPKMTMHLGDDGEWPNKNAFSIDMPAYVDWMGVAGMKWAVATWDAKTDRPISSRILLFDLDRGEFKSVMEGMYLTGVRTALQSVVGLKRLSHTRPASIGVFGAGFQAEFQLNVIDALVGVDEFRVFDTDDDTARAFEQKMDAQVEADVVSHDSPETVASSDAVITVTNSKTPVLKERWLDDPGLVIALGSYRELPDETIFGCDHVIVDDVEQCLQRGTLADAADRGELDRTTIDSTIGEVLADEYQAEIDSDGRVLFVPIGMGSLDIALGELVHGNEAGRGSVSEFEFH
ncbi:ornithine cyclodeaminase family protein [Haloarchaeobius sp. TZWSO28]|uniref:ornithine cyclodeaminase family protein n=1 Tax=Haloarchaeobius sp. TZWSO28 TaxID=3446119 RepID=UPI003EBA91D7